MDRQQDVIFTNDVVAALDSLLDGMEPAGVYMLCDANTKELVMPDLEESRYYEGENVIVIPPGDRYKDVFSLQMVWTALQEMGATRRSVLVNVGGGVVTDLGGFAAATFKRDAFRQCPYDVAWRGGCRRGREDRSQF